MASLKQQLYDTFQTLVNERDQLRLELRNAQETISLLETEVNAIKCHGDAAFAKVADAMSVTKHTFELVAEPTPASHWLKDLWLSEPSSAALLGDAEAAWKENITNPQKALNVVGRSLQGNIQQSERIRCNLFVAAVMVAAGKTEEACAIANGMLHECGNDFRLRNLAGIAHYLRGRVFLELKSLRQAYWDLSLAILTPGYHERAKHFQQYTENLILQEDDSATGSIDQLPMASASVQCGVLKLAPEMPGPL